LRIARVWPRGSPEVDVARLFGVSRGDSNICAKSAAQHMIVMKWARRQRDRAGLLPTKRV